MSATTPRTDERRAFVLDQLKTSEAILTDHPYYILDVMTTLARTLERELAAELLKRQQAEHEKDCILEDLVRAVKLLEASKILKYYVQGVARCNGLSESATAYSKAVDIFLAGDPAALL